MNEKQIFATDIMNDFPVNCEIDELLTYLNDKYPTAHTLDESTYYLLNNVINGLFSGLPPCCVFEYSANGNYSVVMMQKLESLEDFTLFKKYTYVPCLKCLRGGKIVELNNGTIWFNNEYKWIFCANDHELMKLKKLKIIYNWNQHHEPT